MSLSTRDWSRTLIVLLLLPVVLILGKPADDLEGGHITNTWMVEFHSDLSDDDVNSVAQEHGFINHGKIFPDSKLYEFHHPKVAKSSQMHAHEHTERLGSHLHVRSVNQQVGKRRVKRSEPVEVLLDPLWDQTWYLSRASVTPSNYDMNVIPAWRKGYTGKNVFVTILDDGIETDHPDLQHNYAAEASTDINDKDSDPTPRYDYSNENRHGTRCAGEVAAAANNTHCSVGVAYDARIGGIRMLDGSVTDLVEARALAFNPNIIDIYSSSWGPDDNGRTVDGPGKLAQQAFVDGVTKGRNGKGNIFVWASGNGGRYQDSCSCDGYTNSIYTLSVSSVTEGNNSPWYLESCASSLVSTYSSGSSGERQIVSTDLRKTCTTTHTGTSASAPLAAGLIAVMLEANPSLTWRDVQYISLAAANPDPMLPADFKTNGVGRKYSHKFGYGLMDCAKMADMAESWVTVPQQLVKTLPTFHPVHDLSRKLVKEIEVANCSVQSLEHVQMILTMNSEMRGQLTVKVTSPHGTQSIVLPRRSFDTRSSGFTQWPFMSVHFWGENPAGTWILEVDNQGRSGQLESYQLVLYGVTDDPLNSEHTYVEYNRPNTTADYFYDDITDTVSSASYSYPMILVLMAALLHSLV